jgi:NAD(P)-dependent dehydrogenase (short-subunit alcohol dehydrogenase family)
MRDFEGKVAVVTGAASGIGKALAERFAREGMKVVLTDIEKAALDDAVQTLRREEHEVVGVVADVSSAESVDSLAAEAVATFGKVHVLCNNAGVLGANRPLWECSLRDWQWTVGVNLWGVIHGVRSFVPLMLAHGEEGHVVNTASVAGLIPGGGIYGITKHAVVSLSESLYTQLRQHEEKIGVSALCPGFVATNLIDSERNRPAHLMNETTEAPTAEMLAGRAAARERLAGGMAPANIADAVVEAVKEDRFYILPHPEYDEMIQRRMENILKRQNPVPRPLAG